MLSEEEENGGLGLSGKWFGLLLLGITLLLVGIAVLIIASVVLGGSGSVGGIILIGPIPIVFGAGPNSTWLIVIGIIVAVLSIALFIFMSKRGLKE